MRSVTNSLIFGQSHSSFAASMFFGAVAFHAYQGIVPNNMDCGEIIGRGDMKPKEKMKEDANKDETVEQEERDDPKRRGLNIES
ncbi:unnamed protein product [Leptosia nina]|uniref:Uncharacterized protein n=1 Tax=Leptosia nina TaxID=320188 RepID=A0AAV1J391_9NEOP